MSNVRTDTTGTELQIRDGLAQQYSDVYTPEVLAALNFMVQFNAPQKQLMKERIERRQERIRNKRPLDFLDPETVIRGTEIKVQDARDGKFVGSVIPQCLERQWLQGTGPAAKPGAQVASSLRNVAHALLSGADGWMFDGEDALGQTGTMSLDNQRSLKLAFGRDPLFLKVAEEVTGEMNSWSRNFHGRDIITDWRGQLDFTTRIFRPRGLHLDDRHIRCGGTALSASIVDTTLYVANNYRALQADQVRSSSICQRFRPPRRRVSGTEC